MLAHPDTSAGNDGKMTLRRVVAAPNGRTVAIFQDGSLHDIDLTGKKYVQFGRLFTTGSKGGLSFTVSDAHVVVGNTLKSFVTSVTTGAAYLITVDLSASSVTPTEPLLVFDDATKVRLDSLTHSLTHSLERGSLMMPLR